MLCMSLKIKEKNIYQKYEYNKIYLKNYKEISVVELKIL